MTTNRPYLIRALFEWILDNDHTPYLLINTELENVEVPKQFIEDGKIILNISPNAVQDLEIGNEWILFSARFSGSRFDIQLPIQSVIAIYARENGQGMIFPDEDKLKEAESDNTSGEDNRESRPHLTIVK